jgi:hypothetical protein
MWWSQTRHAQSMMGLMTLLFTIKMSPFLLGDAIETSYFVYSVIDLDWSIVLGGWQNSALSRK